MFEEYPKVIYTGGVSVTVADAEEEARWRGADAPATAAPKAPAPESASVTAPTPKAPDVVVPQPEPPKPVEKYPEPKEPTHKGGKKK